jgi:hypothetical protein
MTRLQGAGGADPQVNYEPSILGGLTEAPNDVTEFRLVELTPGRMRKGAPGSRGALWLRAGRLAELAGRIGHSDTQTERFGLARRDEH